MNERKIHIIIISIGILLWAGLFTHSYLSAWHEATPDYQTMENTGELLMHVKGEVQNPGLYSFENGATYQDIIAVAGGLTEKADESGIDFDALCVDGTELIIPKIKTTTSSSTNNSSPTSSSTNNTTPTSKPSPTAKPPSSKITATPTEAVILPLDINQATVQELCVLSGIGEVIAQRIVEYREENGPFLSVEDLLNVKGIGEKKLDAIRQDVYVEENEPFTN